MKKADRRYEAIYRDIRQVVSWNLAHFRKQADTALISAGAQAEALVRTLKAFVLRSLHKKDHAHFVHHFFSLMLKDVLDGCPYLRGRIFVSDGKRKQNEKVY